MLGFMFLWHELYYQNNYSLTIVLLVLFLVNGLKNKNVMYCWEMIK